MDGKNQARMNLRPVRAIIMPPQRRKDTRPSLASLEEKRKRRAVSLRIAGAVVLVFAFVWGIAIIDEIARLL